MECTQVCLKIGRKKLSWLKYVLESYEGLAMCTTLDSQAGLVRVSIAPGAEEDVRKILISLQPELDLVNGWGDASWLEDEKNRVNELN